MLLLAAMLTAGCSADDPRGDAQRSADRPQPDSSASWYERGRRHESDGDDRAAVAAYSAALEREPGAGPVRTALASALMRLGEYDNAARHYAQSLQTGEPTTQLYYQHGLALLAAGRCEEARPRLRQAWQQDQASTAAAEALIRAGASCAPVAAEERRGLVALASELFRALPDTPYAEALAMALAADGQFDNAIRLQRQVVARRPGDVFSQALLERFEKGLPADEPWPPGAAVYSVPRPGSGA